MEYSNIDIKLVTEDTRMQVDIPNYGIHYRQYFENPQGFTQSQTLKESEAIQFSKARELKFREIEERVTHLTKNLS